MKLVCDNSEPGAAETAFQLTEHVCRFCAGRVLRAGERYRCSGCAAATTVSPEGVCGCGMLATFRAGGARFQCKRNPAKSAASPSEYVIFFGDDRLEAAA